MSEDKNKPDFLMPTDDMFELTPDEQARFDSIQHSHAISQCSGYDLVLGGRLDSEANQKSFARSENYVNMANLLRSSDPEGYKAFLANPKEYAKENWANSFEEIWEEAKKSLKF
jgi:hypothetical protein